MSIFYRFRDIAGYLSKVADFDHPTSIWRPRRGDPGRISRRSQKTRVHGVSWRVVSVILHFAVLVEHRLVTDTDTDGHGHRRTQADG